MRLWQATSRDRFNVTAFAESASPIQIAEPLHRKSSRTSGTVEKKDSGFHGLTGELTVPRI
jgi:hypothetical protein